MLKVVGASWVKTRISTYILVGAGVLAIGSLFIAEMERPQFDGTFCATVFYTEKTGFQVEYWKQRNDLEDIPKGVARTCFKDSTHENGWSQLEVETQRNYPDWVQAFAAGILEGALTWKNIYDQWSNTIGSACDRDDDSQNFCTWLRDTLVANAHYIKEKANVNAKHDHYWHQIRLFYYQMEGLELGFKKGAKRSRSGLEIPSEDFLLMNAAADIHDFKIYFENFIMHQNEDPSTERNFLVPSSSMVMGVTKDENNNSRFLFSHSSAGSYASMLRMQKRYKFSYHFGQDIKTNTVPGTDIMFTGYPGILASTDDFYTVKGRNVYSVVSGVTIKNKNINLWKDVNLAELVPLSARVMASNRLSQSLRTWARIMSRNPVTGNKQWLMIDLKKIDASLNVTPQTGSVAIENLSSISQKGAVWMAEQLPGRLHAEDMTAELMAEIAAFWYANGTPYFPSIREASGYSDEATLDAKVDYNFTGLEEIEQYLRERAFRGDLLGEQSVPYGNIDIKLFSFVPKTGHSEFHAIAGPLFAEQAIITPEIAAQNSTKDVVTSASLVIDLQKTVDLEIITDRRPVRNDIRALAMRRTSRGPFKWSQASEVLDGVKHDGHPDVWNFGKVTPRWAW